MVVSYHDTPSALKVLDLVRTQAPKVPVLVRTIDDSDIDRAIDVLTSVLRAA